MTISQALITVLIISVIVGATGSELANNTTILIILLIALIALAGVTRLFQYNTAPCVNRLLNTTSDMIPQTLF